jgi:dipeptidyl aminopeptidase/acylaminoacyl peptidase
LAAKELTKLADRTPWLDEKDLVKMLPITYTTRDGLTINGYLTLPRGGEKKLPLVVHPHGGPWARDEWGYNPEVQFLASRGYAVLQMNFRGSTGYGRKFWEMSFKQWGKAMQDDITDGVQHLIREGVVDRKRVAIYGASYGRLCHARRVSLHARCLCLRHRLCWSVEPVHLPQHDPPYWKPQLDMWHEMVGHPERDKALLEAASPVLHVDKIRAPLLIAQGAKDPRVNVDESDQMVAALKKRGVAIEYILKDNEGHGFPQRREIASSSMKRWSASWPSTLEAPPDRQPRAAQTNTTSRAVALERLRRSRCSYSALATPDPWRRSLAASAC